MSGQRTLSFYKMHSLGNDFMVLDGVTRHFDPDAAKIAAWSDRHTGIGFDQLLIIQPPTDPEVDFQYRIFNADGSEAEQCGNGTRCVMLLVHHLGLAKKRQLVWQSLGGQFSTSCVGDAFSTTMSDPVLSAPEIPFDPASCIEQLNGQQYRLSSELGEFDITPVSMGNPHGVIFVDDIFGLDIESVGASLTGHAAFPARANIGFCQVIDRQFVRLRVYERGVGETQACGSGACAAVVAARLNDLVNPRVKVSLPGGKLRIHWDEDSNCLEMSGPATLVYTGEVKYG